MGDRRSSRVGNIIYRGLKDLLGVCCTTKRHGLINKLDSYEHLHFMSIKKFLNWEGSYVVTTGIHGEIKANNDV